MNIKDYILLKIKTQLSNNYIWISECDIQCIYEDVMSGVYAFRIIYEDCDKYDTHIKSESYKLKEYSHLDYRLLKEFSEDSDLISIDGGKRFQWNKREVLFIDPIEIRDLKLKEIGI